MSITIENSYFERIEITDIQYAHNTTRVIYKKEHDKFGIYNFEGFISLETIVRKLCELSERGEI